MGCCQVKPTNPQNSVLDKTEPTSVETVQEQKEKSSIPITFKSKYKLGKELGRGNYSTVKLAQNIETKQKFAVKCIKDSDLSEEDRKALKFEINILHKLDHPNIVKLYDFFPEKPVYYIVMEYVSGGELFDKIIEKEFYHEKDAAKVMKTVCTAIKYCHDRGIVHRDLKPENILLTKEDEDGKDGSIKLADFGFAKMLPNAASSSGGLTTSCGTPGYVAPEILKGNSYGKEVDIWSLGVILYILLCGYPPFIEEKSTGMHGLFDKIKRAEYSFSPIEYWKHVSDDGKSLIKRMLKVDPKERLTIDEVLNDRWVKMGEEELDGNAMDISSALKQLKQYQARKKWRMGFHAVTAANRISQVYSSSRKSASTSTEVVEKESKTDSDASATMVESSSTEEVKSEKENEKEVKVDFVRVN